MTGPDDAQVLVKFEAVNVGGSVKTRTALKMIERAEERGELGPDSIIVEPTSGNQGVGTRPVAAVKGYAARIIMPDSCSVERRAHHGALRGRGGLRPRRGATSAAASTSASPLPRRWPRRIRACSQPQQFVNRDNLAAHVDGTAAEILADARGRHRHRWLLLRLRHWWHHHWYSSELRTVFPKVQIWAAEPEHAALLSGGAIGTHVQMGIGDGILPAIMDTAHSSTRSSW